jgi:thioredoxin 1
VKNKIEKIVQLNITNWKDIILNSDIPVLVDFWAEWCGPCRMVSPIVEQLANSLEGKIKVSKLNVDQNPEIAAEYNIQSIPSLVLFKNGKEINRIVGLSPKEKYEKFVYTTLNL